MQNDRVLKKPCSEKAEFRPIDPIPKSAQGGGGGLVLGVLTLTPSPGSGGALFHKKQTRGPSGPKSLT